MSDLISYITTHWVEIVAAVGAIAGAARIIVKLTPTPRDDSALDYVVSFLKHLGLQIKD